MIRIPPFCPPRSAGGIPTRCGCKKPAEPSRCRAATLLLLILLAPLGAQGTEALDREATRLCQTFVGVRVGNLLAVSVEAVTRLPKRQQWLVTGRVRQRPTALHFVCRLSHPAGRWQLEQLELLQWQQAARD